MGWVAVAFLFLNQSFSSTSSASEVRLGLGGGNQQDKLFSLEGRVDSEDETAVLLSFTSEGAPGQKVNEGKIGYEAPVSTVTTFSGDILLRSEPDSVKVFGVEPGFEFTFSDTFLAKRKTSFLLIPNFSIYSISVTGTGPFRKKVLTKEENLSAVGITLGVSQELSDFLLFDLSGSAWHYSTNPDPVSGRLFIPAPTEAGNGANYPTWSVDSDLKWDFVDQWTFTPDASVEHSLLLGATIYSWSASLKYAWSTRVDTEFVFTSTSAATETGELFVRVALGGEEKKRVVERE